MITGDFVNGTSQFLGVSTDTKPTNVSMNALFLELDTGDLYFFNGTTWALSIAGGGELPAAESEAF